MTEEELEEEGGREEVKEVRDMKGSEIKRIGVEVIQET